MGCKSTEMDGLAKLGPVDVSPLIGVDTSAKLGLIDVVDADAISKLDKSVKLSRIVASSAPIMVI